MNATLRALAGLARFAIGAAAPSAAMTRSPACGHRSADSFCASLLQELVSRRRWRARAATRTLPGGCDSGKLVYCPGLKLKIATIAATDTVNAQEFKFAGSGWPEFPENRQPPEISEAPTCDASMCHFPPEIGGFFGRIQAVLHPKSSASRARKFAGNSKSVGIDENPLMLHM
jgi:hypothetical protein